MIQLVVNTNMLREIDERKLINAYARFMYIDEKDVTDDIQIKTNLIELFDWDINGDNGLGIYCGKFEKIKGKIKGILAQKRKIGTQECRKIKGSSVRSGWDSNPRAGCPTN